MLRRRAALPPARVGRSQVILEGNDGWIVFSQVREEVFEREEGVTDVGFGPVDKGATLRSHNDVAGIEVTVPERIRDLQGAQTLQGILNGLTEVRELLPGKHWRRHLRLLVHQLRHGVEERVD